MEAVQNCFWELAVLSQQDDPQFCSDFELGIGTLLRGGVFNINSKTNIYSSIKTKQKSSKEYFTARLTVRIDPPPLPHGQVFCDF